MKAGQPGVPAVQLQADGESLQGAAPIPGRAEEPAIQQQVVDPSQTGSVVQGLKAVGKECTSSSRAEECKLPPKPYVPQWKKGKNRQSFNYFR